MSKRISNQIKYCGAKTDRNIKILNYFIFILLNLYLVIDSLTGIMLHEGGVSFSIPYKIFVAIIMFVVVMCYNKTSSVFLMWTLVWLFLMLFVMFLEKMANINLAVQLYSKLLVNFIFYKYFSKILKDCAYDNYIEDFIRINSIIFIVNIFLGILGFGYSTYSYGVGVKGFFYAGNEIFLILLSITVFYLLKNPKNRRTKYIYMISIITAIAIGTKTAMLAVIIICFTNHFVCMRKKYKILFLFCLPVLICIFIIFIFPLLAELKPVASAIYNFHKVKEMSGSILNALLSNRINFLEDNLHNWKLNLNFNKFIFGSATYADSKSVEIDFFDTMIVNGAIVTTSVLIFYFNFIIVSFRIKNYLLIIFNIIILLISFSAGHIWSNLTGGIFFVITNVYAKEKYMRRIDTRNLK